MLVFFYHQHVEVEEHAYSALVKYIRVVEVYCQLKSHIFHENKFLKIQQISLRNFRTFENLGDFDLFRETC